MGEDNQESSDEELMAVASAEEYAAKITKLQQACLIPLKEDLAEWLNKILQKSNITTENFMEKLDNGVIICRLAKIISLWCEQQLTSQGDKESNSTWMRDYIEQVREAKNVPDARTPTAVSFISASSTNIHLSRNDKIVDLNSHRPPISRRNNCNNIYTNINGPLRSSTINCLTSSASATSLNNTDNSPSIYHHSSSQFLLNLVKMHQTKIWEDAKCRTFYARDNVCNFIKWSRDFGVNRSVLFESDDLVQHANPRQVVLCLLDVARIAYVKYGFTEAPGLVKFEQEIDRELRATESGSMLFHHDEQPIGTSSDAHARATLESTDKQTGPFNRDALGDAPTKTKRSIARKMDPLPIDATDKLVMRYCRHKEEEAARKKNEELAATNVALNLAAQSNDMAIVNEVQSQVVSDHESKSSGEQQIINSNTRIEPNTSLLPARDDSSVIENQAQLDNRNEVETMNSMMPYDGNELALDTCDDYDALVSSTTCDSKTHNKQYIIETGRVDSLDEGEGPTESASTGYSSQFMGDSLADPRKGCNQSTNHTSIPIPMKRTNYTQNQTNYLTESSMQSELSSSRSSLLSVQDGNITSSRYERQATSDLDGKVMRIAKSYYGKKATKDVTRLSEGKYKIADRIVFVRLLKGHRVMVRIGGGWDTLENFLFRHKSDPSQVIDPDNLLPLETKMPFDKNVQATPSKSTSKLPYYRINNSASTNSLSLTNLSISKHSLLSSTSRITQNNRRLNGDAASKSEQSSPMIEHRLRQPHFPQHFNAHKGQTNATDNLQQMDSTPDHLSPSQSSNIQKNRILQAITIHNTPVGSSQIRRPFYYQKTTAPNTASKLNHQRPSASSIAQVASASNIHLYDSSSPVRSQAARRDRGPIRKLLLK